MPASLLVTSAADPAGPLVPGTLRYEVNQANQDAFAGVSDTITFDTTQMGTSTVTLLQGQLNLGSLSGPSAGETIDGGGDVTIDAQHNSRVFQIVSTGQILLTGLTIQNGTGDADGGGIENGGTLAVTNSLIRGNFASNRGGGIYNTGTLTVGDGTTVVNNTADIGGGIANDGVLATVSYAEVASNQASFGGAISNEGGTLNVNNTAVENNTPGQDGVCFGGGIFNDGGTANVINTTLTSNRASIGGGIYNQGGGSLFVTNATDAYNDTNEGGSGITNADGELVLQSTIVAHTAVFTNPELDVAGAVDSVSSFNLIGDGSGMSGISNGVNGNQIGTAANPIDPMLGDLGNNGGPTDTYQLKPGSPAIRNGSSDAPQFDQRGFPRPLSGPVDVGAFQTQYGTAVAVQPATGTYSPVNAQQVTLSATVTEFQSPLPDAEGTVTFTLVNPFGANLTTTAAVTDQSVASVSMTLPPAFLAGTYAIDASYADPPERDGYVRIDPASGTGILTVNPAPTTTTLAAIPPVVSQSAPQLLSLSAQVVSGTLPILEGAVTFSIGNLLTVTATVSNGSAVATLILPAGFAAGNYPVTAAYADVLNANDAADFGASLDARTLTVLPSNTVSGTVFNDQNGDGIRESGEPALTGWIIDLKDSSGNILQTAPTDGSGNYTFAGVGSGTFTVAEEAQAGWVQTSSPATYSLTLSSGMNVTGQDFGNFQLAQASGTVYNDQNDNHIQDTGEPGLAGVTIQLDGSPVATTDSTGAYTITGIGPGKHIISEVIPAAYMATAPGSGSAAFTPTSGSTTTTNFADALPTMTKDNDQAGYDNAPAGQWSLLQSGWEGTSRTHAATNNPMVSASWMLTPKSGLPTGKYEVFVTYPPSSGRTTVQYQLYDGQQSPKNLLGTVTVDQTATPLDGTYQGIGWQSLGRYQVQSGKLIVVMTGTVSDATRTMDADGVLLIPANSGQGPQGSAVSAPGPGLTTTAGQVVVPTPAAAAPAAIRSTGTPHASSVRPSTERQDKASSAAAPGAVLPVAPAVGVGQPAAGPLPTISSTPSELASAAVDPRVSWAAAVPVGKKGRSRPDSATATGTVDPG
jgi:hypothetical protein